MLWRKSSLVLNHIDVDDSLRDPRSPLSRQNYRSRKSPKSMVNPEQSSLVSEIFREKNLSYSAVKRIAVEVQHSFSDSTLNDDLNYIASLQRNCDESQPFDAINNAQKKMQILLKKLESFGESWETVAGKEIEEPNPANFQLRMDENELKVYILYY